MPKFDIFKKGNKKNDREKREIILSPKGGRVLQLAKKLEEYLQRLPRCQHDPVQYKNTMHKVWVMTELLRGKVDFESLQVDMKQKYSSFDPKCFENAFNVIQDYNDTGGQNISSGYGLPDSR